MHAPATRIAAWRQTAERFTAGGASLAARIESWRTTRVIATLVGVQWLCVLGLALAVRHNGWVYYQGGDQLWYYTLGWLLGHGALWQTPVGYGWSALLAPISWFAGRNAVSALPAIVLLNVLVLLPAAMLALYGIAARIGGRLFGYWALALWITVPYIGILYTNVGYHQRYTELTLPQSLGLTAMSDFPSTVATVVSLYFCARVVLDEKPALFDALAAGAAGGFAIGIKPATTFFLAGPALAFAARRYLPYAAAYAAGMAPAVLTLAVWKERGLGYLPAVGHIAGRPFAGLAAGAPLLGLGGLDQYFRQLTWSRLMSNVDLLREHFWSGHFLVWVFIAGLIGLLRASPRAFLLIGGAIVPFTLAKGSYTGASIEDASLFRLLMPCFPGFIVALASLPLLLPHAPARLRAFAPIRLGISPRGRVAALAAAFAVTSVLPLAAVAAADTSPAQQAAFPPRGQMPIPVGIDLAATARIAKGRVDLSWRPAHSVGGRLFYRVWRSAAQAGGDLSCAATTGAPQCQLTSVDLGGTRATTFTDRPPHGRWIYRVAVAANWLDDPSFGDPYLAGKPIPITMP